MQVGIQPTRNFATLGPLLLRPPFTWASIKSFATNRQPHQLTFKHRAGVTPYTSSCELAKCCVFDKQSGGTLCCNLFGFLEQVHIPKEAHLIPKLRCQFAEFLNQGSSTRLRILISPTCVGLRYGQLIIHLEAFLGTTVSTILNLLRRASSACQASKTAGGFSYPAYLHPSSHYSISDLVQPYASPLRTKLSVGIGILTNLPSLTPFGLSLGPDQPYIDEHRVGTLGFTANRILTCFIATHACMLTSSRSTTPYRYGFNADQNALLPLELLFKSTTSVSILAPLYFRRRIARPVSCYAFFKGWLLLSQPPGCLSNSTSFSTQIELWDLSRQSGLFPFRHRILSPYA
eukprot:TRINITY_DN2943_c0_g5_i1.p1 TRINITY_DN2943_c0_g5~~TRINITY_DN2943_c0_g5_i1.p1  ORF type:complete len:346 (-),score=-62.27 TRINITY_DN2943_c0_g5_i1:565-1602(-)